MVLLLGASAFYLNEARGDTKDEYAKLVETARMYAENGIKGDAVTKYKEALSISSSFELALEAGEVYLQEDDYRGAQKWYEDVLSAEYPRDARTYEFGIEAYVAKKDYEEAFEAYDVYESRCREKSEKVEKLLEEIEYTYGVTGNFTHHGEFGASSGLAAAESEGLWGYVDSKGNFKIKKGYVSAGFMGTSAPVVNAKGSAYYIYKDGTVAYTHEDFEKANPDFGKIERFKECVGGIALAYNGKEWAYFNEATKKMLFGGFADATVIANGVGAVTEDGEEWYLIGADGKRIGDESFDEVCVSSKGYVNASGTIIAGRGGKYRLYDPKGGRVGSAEYAGARAFEGEGMAAVKKSGKWIFVASDGTESDFGYFEDAKSFSNGFAAVKKKGLWGYAAEDGTIAVEPAFVDAGNMSASGTAFVSKREDSWGILGFYKYSH